jgi:hypothetical protein
MQRQQFNALTIGFLALVLSVGAFLAGYLLMSPANSRDAVPPVLAATSTASAPATPPPAPGLIVTRAVYGDLPDGGSIDVTEKVAALVAHNTLSVAASNDNFGDPASGIVKKLRVEYTLQGVANSRTVEENATLVIKSGPEHLIIRKAIYGDLPDGSSTDVTSKVAQAVADDALSIGASNDNFGDPAAGITKILRVDYTFDGKERSKTVHEGQTLTISNTGQ